MIGKVVLFLSLIISVGQSKDSPEQVAMDHLLANAFMKYEHKFGFDGELEKNHSRFMTRTPCFETEDGKTDFLLKGRIEELADSLDNSASITPVILDVSSSERKIKKKGKNLIGVYRATKINDKYYVEIELNFNGSYAHFYFYEISKSLRVIRTCESREIY